MITSAAREAGQSKQMEHTTTTDLFRAHTSSDTRHPLCRYKPIRVGERSGDVRCTIVEGVEKVDERQPAYGVSTFSQPFTPPLVALDTLFRIAAGTVYDGTKLEIAEDTRPGAQPNHVLIRPTHTMLRAEFDAALSAITGENIPVMRGSGKKDDGSEPEFDFIRWCLEYWAEHSSNEDQSSIGHIIHRLSNEFLSVITVDDPELPHILDAIKFMEQHTEVGDEDAPYVAHMIQRLASWREKHTTQTNYSTTEI